MNSSSTEAPSSLAARDVMAASDDGFPIGAVLAALWRRRVMMIGLPLLASGLALGGSYLVQPTFTARVSFLPPQQQQGAAAGALASLGALAGIASVGARNTGDQYVAFVQSATVADKMVDRFKLMDRYEREFRVDARKILTENTRVSMGRKDGVISLEVDDHDPKTAADMATAYIEELRTLTAGLALTEAQARRAFFERQLQQVRVKLTEAQKALAATGVNLGALKAEPKATAEGIAKLKAELTTAEVKLQVLRRAMSDNAAEVIAQSGLVAALRAEMAKQGRGEEPTEQGSYITAYRDYKYQETLFDQIARQYEIARIDESRDGGQLQVVDRAEVPERKSKPKRSIFMLVAFAVTFLLCAGWVTVREIKGQGRPAA